MSKFHEILKNRDFFLLWLGQIISQIGDRLSQMALIGFVYLRAPGSTIEMAKILSFTIIPVFVIGPIAGVYVDRWNRRRTMFICDLIRAILVLTIPLFLFYSKNLSIIYVIIFLTFSIGRFFVPAKLSIVPELVLKKDLLLANSLVNTTGMLAAVFGFGVSGLVVEWMGPKSGFYLDALSFLFSGLCIFFIGKKTVDSIKLREKSHKLVEVIKKSLLSEIKEGVFYFIKNKNIRFTAAIIFILWSALGAIYVVLIAFIQKNLHSATKDLGLLIMFLGFGLFSGSILYGRFGSRISPYKMIFSSLIVSGIMLILFASGIQRYPCFLTAGLLAFVFGITVAPIMIASNTIVHNVSENHMHGKIFSSMEIVMHLGFLIFMFISSMLAEIFTPASILISVGGIVIALGVLTLALHNKIVWLD
ncbi:MAG: MFS transporter [Candidatus Omnitrophica bacterium]|nr:MFS transporter [Candidatus Omnitrophota bacterium]